METQFMMADNASSEIQSRLTLRLSVSERRAALVAAFALEMEGAVIASNGDIHVPVSVAEFEQALRAGHGAAYPELVYRTDSTLERARLERPAALRHIAKVILRQGAPRRSTP
jgi:hypothetical protein